MADLLFHTGCAKVALVDASGSRHFKVWTAAGSATTDSISAPVDQTFELAAGASIVLTKPETGTAGSPTSLAPSAIQIDVFEDNSATLVRSFAGLANAASTHTFFATSDGTSGGTPRAGTYRLRIQASRIDALATDWRVNSDNTNTLLATGQSIDYGSGGIRGGTALSSVVYSDIALGGADPANNRYVYPKSQFFRATLGNQALPQGARSITLSQRQAGVQKSTDAASASTANPAVLDITRTGGVGAASGVNNAFIAADTSTAIRLLPANSTLSALPWTHWTSLPAGWTGVVGSKGVGLVQADSPAALFTVDPRITFSQLLQLNDAAFGTPPATKNVASGQRLASDLGFIAARTTDAHGAGINGLAWTEKLWDSGNLISSEAAPWKSRASTSQAQGGETGWSDAFMTWDAALPGGGWSQKEIITTANATGLERTNTRTLTLLAANPNFRPLCAAGPASTAAEADHWHAGDDLLITFTVIDMSTRLQLTLDASPAPAALILRYDQTLRRLQYLDASFVWVNASTGPAPEHAFTVSPNDPKSYELTIPGASTAGWGNLDLFAIVPRGYVNATPYITFAVREAVGNANGHAKYAFDPTGLFK